MSCEMRLSPHVAYPWASSVAAGWAGNARGYAFWKGRRLTAAELASEACVQAAAGTFPAFVYELNGSFCLISTDGTLACVAVDRVRSLPLFYRSTTTCLVIADDPLATLSQGEAPRLQSASVGQVLRCGYTVGDATLIEGVSQLEAGQYLLRNQRGESRPVFYYQHLHLADPGFDLAQMRRNLERVSTTVFRRFIEQLDGRTCVVPLSGGYDSRYVLCMLHRLGYRNVVCFTYGASDSAEIPPARGTAERLGYPWHLVEYGPGIWERFLSSADAREYLATAGNWTSLPHVQEYPALLWLTEHDLLPQGAVYAPGFCGDLLGGSYIPAQVQCGLEKAVLEQGIAEYIYASHMVLPNRLRAGLETQLLAQVTASLDAYPPVTSLEDLVSVNEAWFTTHKVAKFVVNALRAYEHFGYEWLMPLWDNEFAESWYAVPLEYRIGSALYDEFLFDWLFRPLGVAFEKRPPLKSRWPVSWLEWAIPASVFADLRSVYGRAKMRMRPPDPNAFSDLALQLRVVGRHEGVQISRSPDVNQALAPLYLSQLSSRFGATGVFDAVYAGPGSR